MENNKKIDEKIPEKNVKSLKTFEVELNSQKLSPFTSSLNETLKNLSVPRFLGSYHLKEAINPKFKSIDNILRGNFQLKYTKSLRNVIFNPITITLIIIALAFNLFWLFLILF